METELFARHGDLVISRSAIPDSVELTKPGAPVVLAGRESAPHTIGQFGAVLYGRRDAVQFVRALEPVELTHSERHKPIALPAGDYHIASLAEMSGDLARAVDD